MKTLSLEEQILALVPRQLAESKAWDAQIKNDSRSGALDFLAQEALKNTMKEKTELL